MMMTDPFEKAEMVHARADEHRRLADQVREPVARTCLFEMAENLDWHAHSLLDYTNKVRGLQAKKEPSTAAGESK